MPRFRDLTGQRFHRLTVIEKGPRKGVKTVWRCLCDCGNESLAHSYDLTHNKHKSCGCLQLEKVTKHGASSRKGVKEPTYSSWISMKDRCSNPNSPFFRHYGGRGISVCKRWQDSYEAFVEDMGLRPSPIHSIDRIDVNGPYSPENCRWATKKEQSRNRRDNRLLTYQGETLSVMEWVDRLGIDEQLIRSRLKLGWKDEEILSLPTRSQNERQHDSRGRWAKEH